MFLIDLIKPFKKIKIRLTFIFTLTFFVVALLFSFFYTKTFINITQQDFDSQLREDAFNLSQKIEHNEENRPLEQLVLLDQDQFFILRNLNGEVVYESKNNFAKNLPYQSDFSGKLQYSFNEFEVEKANYRMIQLTFGAENVPKKIIQLGKSTSSMDKKKSSMISLNIAGIVIFIILTGAISYMNTESSLRPIKMISETVNSIATKNLSKRLPSFEMSAEFAELSTTFNGLLERLEKSFAAQEHFVANASHQLYTPLAIIKGELEVLQSKERTLEEYQKFHHSLKQELERMVDLVKNLLLISRIEAGHEDSFKMRPLRLDDMIISTTTRMKVKAREKQISIKFNLDENLEVDDLIINGERQLLSSLFENLIDNSIKYSPAESVINVGIKKDNGIVVSVQDEGPGIKQNELKTILEKRFQRGTMTLMPGTGIGLSIAYKIAAHHKASIDYEKLQPKGSLFKVYF